MLSAFCSNLTSFLNVNQKPGFLNRGKGLRKTRLTQVDACWKKKKLNSWPFTHVTRLVTGVSYTWKRAGYTLQAGEGAAVTAVQQDERSGIFTIRDVSLNVHWVNTIKDIVWFECIILRRICEFLFAIALSSKQTAWRCVQTFLPPPS